MIETLWDGNIPTMKIINEKKENVLRFGFHGEKEGYDSGVYFLKLPATAEEARRKGAEAVSVMEKVKAKEGFAPTSELGPLARYFVEGVLLADYKFASRRKGEEEKTLYVDYSQNLEELEQIKEAVFFARDIINEAPSIMNPEEFSKRALTLEDFGLEVFIGDPKWMKEEGFFGTLAVGRGSEIKPRVVLVKYTPLNPKGKIALIGKGITFDSGGLNLKPSKAIKGMHMDMAGAGAVLATMKLLPALEPEFEVLGIMPLAENLPSASSYKPGDIIEMANGKTVEVDNTDAEGRLALADALIYAEKHGADVIVDLATLTGAAVVALGELLAALYTPSDQEASQFLKASDKTGEMLWRMPLVKEYEDELKSSRADIKNAGYKRNGGSIMAALFLKEFVSRENWVHLDIAGPAMIEKPFYYMPAGATGFGVRLLIEYLRGKR